MGPVSLIRGNRSPGAGRNLKIKNEGMKMA
jgi:hypothetical protein